jgi:hypothetical protein
LSHESSVSRERANQALIRLFVLAYFAVLGVSASCRHLNGHSTFFDLGVMDNFVWQTLHGRLFFFGDHFAPILFVFVPLYAIWANTLVLILGQALALASGAWFVYQIAHRRFQKGAWVFTGLYALHPTVLHVAMFDFHPIVLGGLRRVHAGLRTPDRRAVDRRHDDASGHRVFRPRDEGHHSGLPARRDAPMGVRLALRASG